jgi:hypothetical protein
LYTDANPLDLMPFAKKVDPCAPKGAVAALTANWSAWVTTGDWLVETGEGDDDRWVRHRRRRPAASTQEADRQFCLTSGPLGPADPPNILALSRGLADRQSWRWRQIKKFEDLQQRMGA